MVGGVSMSIKSYKMTITTMGPVHVGSGDILKKQNYIYDFFQSKAYIINGPKLLKYLHKKKLANHYFEFLQHPPRNNRENGLINFLDKYNVPKNDWNQFTDYTMQVNQGKKHGNKRPKPLNDLHTFVRDGRNDVYIPGSSIKGALRTVLNAYYNNELTTEDYSKLKVSDSEIIDKNALAIYQKIDINKRDQSMPLYRECIGVGVHINTMITIEDDIFTIEDIKNAIIQAYNNYQTKWLEGFHNTPGGRRFSQNGGLPDCSGEPIIYLGAGAGFVSKTEHYQTKPKERAKKDSFGVLRNKFRKVYGKMREIPENVPVALKTTYNFARNEWYQQGMCRIEFNNINN